MALKKAHNLKTSVQSVKDALEFYEQGDASDDIKFLAVSKAFEVAVEYGWKELKLRVEGEGLEALSPKDAIRQAARLEMISEAEVWLEFINARNSGVHDYFGLPRDHYLTLVKRFIAEATPLVQK